VPKENIAMLGLPKQKNLFVKNVPKANGQQLLALHLTVTAIKIVQQANGQTSLD